MNKGPIRERSYYAPYDQHPIFDLGFNAYNQQIHLNPFDPNSIEALAWDRGQEYASYLWWRKQPDRETD
jgi:hypothetical protein